MPDTIRRRATIIGNSMCYVDHWFRKDVQRQNKAKLNEVLQWEQTQSRFSPALVGWTTIADMCQTITVLLQLKGTNQSQHQVDGVVQSRKYRHGYDEKMIATQQLYCALHEIGRKLVKVAENSDPSSLPSFWAMCSRLKGVCARMESTGRLRKRGMEHIRLVKKRGAPEAQLQQMREKLQAKRAAKGHTFTLTIFLRLMRQGAMKHENTHPWRLILDGLCDMAPDELEDTLRLAHEHTIRTFENYLQLGHPFILHEWSQFIRCWREEQRKTSSFFTSYGHTFLECQIAPGLDDDFRLLVLYQYTLACWYHSNDSGLKLDLGQLLYERSRQMQLPTGSIQDTAVMRAIYLSITILGSSWIQNRNPEGISRLEEAISILKEGDNSCKARAVELSGQLAALYKRSGNQTGSEAARARLVEIRSSIPRSVAS